MFNGKKNNTSLFMFLLQGLKACNAKWLFLGMADISLFIIRQNQKQTQYRGTRCQSEEVFLMFLSKICEMV